MSFDFLRDTHKKVHFIGIGGVSMSGLAEILIENGYKVSGSDRSESENTKKLREHGAEIYIGQSADNIKDVDLVVYTAAIAADNPEIMKAKEENIASMNRAEFLGSIMKGHKYGVAIAGTHGKTSTTSMMSHIVLEEKLDPTILVGGNLDVIGGNVHIGKSDYFITEACEYKESFLKFYPYIGVILNVEEDHLDYYRDLNHIKDAFRKFISIIPDDGYAIVNADDENSMDVIKDAKCNVMTFGIENGEYRARNLKFNDLACGIFDLYKNDEKLFTVELNVPGKYNVLNAMSIICASLALNISHKSIVDGLFNFRGTHRRFEFKGERDGVKVIDDYAHHPTAIKSLLGGIKNYPHNRTFFIFQPHTYTRTSTLFDEFVQSFEGIENLILEDIYAAREKDTGIVSSQKLGDAVRKTGVNAINMHSFEDTVKYLNENVKEGDLILTVGAGDVYKIGEMFINQ
ncbi:UDP-N-acetylmuramate--L-alanine ligase [Clostridium ihumii]|uniref:UDP-N-acetylmuramate--L-alanine ligase n=1 Tax=Clostridium ihumii TaxID=1470356 RepID=UPI003D33D84E